MLLTTQQVSEKLGVSRSVVHRMIKDGTLTPVNKRKDGAKKFFPKFNSKDINSFKKTAAPKRTVGKAKLVSVTPVPNVLSRMADKLDELSAKIDALYKMWQ